MCPCSRIKLTASFRKLSVYCFEVFRFISTSYFKGEYIPLSKCPHLLKHNSFIFLLRKESKGYHHRRVNSLRQLNIIQRDYAQLILPNQAQSALCLAPFGDDNITFLFVSEDRIYQTQGIYRNYLIYQPSSDFLPVYKG